MPNLGPSNSPCQPSFSSSASSSLESSGGEDDGRGAEVELLYPIARPAFLAQHLLRVPQLHARHSSRLHAGAVPRSRRKREMTPAVKKDATYWGRRQKNNEAAKRSREKRRLNDLMMEGELLALSDENAQLRAEVLTMQYHLGFGRGPNKAAAGAVPSGLPLQHVRPQAPYLYPVSTLFQAGGMWGQGSRHSPAAFMLGMKQREMASYGLGSSWQTPPTDGDLRDPPRSQGGHKQELLQGDHLGTSTQHNASCSLLPVPGFSATSTSITRPEGWLMPQLHHPAWQDKPMVHWASGYLSPPGLPLFMAMEYGGERPPAGEPASGSRYFCSPHV
ncbi:Nuclear factor interleukin-3-regulated protein [Merluccius polli]|uniref:Nuclear factor interleukin-3-regulated protein n=1 Tax=Merluccius polli TaxID=89951 RepID=A0AA47MYQ4_MERPO|nr:Nuclear factor interleukin-3-regulated protein [Merluccius polli]